MTAFLLAYSVSALLFFSFYYVQQLHMFQLHAYQVKAQAEWLKKNFMRSVLPVLILSLCAAGCIIVDSPFRWAGVAFHLIGILCYLPKKKVKKPLVFTMRIVRMCVTAGILFVLIGSSAVLFTSMGVRYILLAVPLMTALSPCSVFVCNAINQPVEQAVRRHYIRQAQQKIESLPNLTVIGITGSYGKTSTKYFLTKLLSKKYQVFMTPKSYNTTMGVVKTIREDLQPAHEIFVCEMGAKSKGEIKEICDIVHPKHGMITSIGPQHLETFGSIETVISTKFELCDALPSGGMIFLNRDNEYIETQSIDSEKAAVYYGTLDSTACDFYAKDIRVTEAGTEFTVVSKDPVLPETRFATKLIGKHNVINLVGCIAVAAKLGVDAADLVMAVRRIESVPHRLEVLDQGKRIMIDDAFNSNPAGAQAALEALGQFEGCKILITPGMVELGTKQEECNRIFGEQAGHACDYILLVGKTNADSIRRGALSAGFAQERLFSFDTLEQALQKADQIESGQRQVILLENDLPDNYS